MNPKSTLWELIQNKGKVQFADESSIEYDETTKKEPFIKVIAPGGRAFAYDFNEDSCATVMILLGHTMDMPTKE